MAIDATTHWHGQRCSGPGRPRPGPGPTLVAPGRAGPGPRASCFGPALEGQGQGPVKVGRPWPGPARGQCTRTLSAGTGFWRVRVRVALEYPRVTRDNP